MKIITLKKYINRLKILREVEKCKTSFEYFANKYIRVETKEGFRKRFNNFITGIPIPDYGYHKIYAPPIPKQEVKERPGIGSTQIPIIFKSKHFNDKENNS